MIQDEPLMTLMELGLSLPQAKTYLNLVRLKKADVKTIAKSSNVATQDIYRIMPKLQKMGLIEKIITTPTMYKATPLKEGASILLQRRAKEYANLEMKTKMLQENPLENNIDTEFHDNTSQFVITSERFLVRAKFGKANDTAQKSIDIVGTWEGFKSDINNGLKHALLGAMKRGARVRLIIEKQDTDDNTLKTLKNLKKNTLFNIRYSTDPIPVKIVIYDDIEAVTSIAKQQNKDLPYLWSNNPSFVKVMMFQFEEIWNKSREGECETFNCNQLRTG